MTNVAKPDGKLAFLLVIVGAVAMCGGLLQTAAAASLVMTEYGWVRGIEAPGANLFLGIPYAAPPVGALRWQSPHPHAPWQDVLDGTKFGSHCAQTARIVGIDSSSESCLFLNVFVPTGGEDSSTDGDSHGRAVLVWLHGGAFTAGESDDFDARRLANAGGVIVVTLNYRLGVFGFLAHPALTAESPSHTSGNYGILDQQFAFGWVKRNARAFGGDPGRVTIFGQSAGGLSVLANMASPGAAGLFQRAIVQSGAYELTLPSLATVEAQGTAFASAAGCTSQTAQCLRFLSVQQILANPIAATPVVDGFVLPLSLVDAAASGQFARVPVMNGSNRDEARFQVAISELAGQMVTAAQYPAVLVAEFGSQLGPLVLARYPLANYVDADEALAAIETDASFACSARLADQALSQYVPLFAYEFNDEAAPEIFLPPVSYPYGAAHESELQYLFPAEDLTHLAGPPPQLNDGQRRLSRLMMRYWTRFAKTGDPNADPTPAWHKYATSVDQFQALAPASTAPETDFAARHACAFWSAVYHL